MFSQKKEGRQQDKETIIKVYTKKEKQQILYEYHPQGGIKEYHER